MSIADKIKAIIAKAESTTSEDEAMTFMAKAHQLLEKHGLSLAMLDIKSSDDPVAVDIDGYSFAVSEMWQRKLVHVLAKYYGGDTIWTREGNKIFISVAGRESVRITCRLMFPFVIKQVRQQARQLMQHGYTYSKAKTAVGNALTLRVWNLVWELDATNNDQAKEVRNALVPVDAIKLAIKNAFGEIEPGRPTKISTTNKATNAANSISISKQTDYLNTKRLK